MQPFSSESTREPPVFTFYPADFAGRVKRSIRFSQSARAGHPVYTHSWTTVVHAFLENKKKRKRKENVPQTVTGKENVPQTITGKANVPQTITGKENVPQTITGEENVVHTG